MKAVVQRVTEASVSVAGEPIADMAGGLVVLLGVVPEDDDRDVDALLDKVLTLRIFADADKPMNRSLEDVDGAMLVVSQFTLAADTRRGRRPSFTSAAAPEQAERLYDAFVAAARARRGKVVSGWFGADMAVALVNDGPVTFVLDTR